MSFQYNSKHYDLGNEKRVKSQCIFLGESWLPWFDLFHLCHNVIL